MEMDFDMFINNNENLLIDIQKCNSISKSFRFHNSNQLIFDIKPIAILIDIYETKYEIDKKDMEFLKDFSSLSLITAEDIKYNNEEIKNGEEAYIGEWNINFLKYIKSLTIKHKESIVISYQHERGDWLYEEACWLFDSSDSNIFIEEFELTNWFGNEKPLWKKKLIRKNDGIIVQNNIDPSND